MPHAPYLALADSPAVQFVKGAATVLPLRCGLCWVQFMMRMAAGHDALELNAHMPPCCLQEATLEEIEDAGGKTKLSKKPHTLLDDFFFVSGKPVQPCACCSYQPHCAARRQLCFA